MVPRNVLKQYNLYLILFRLLYVPETNIDPTNECMQVLFQKGQSKELTCQRPGGPLPIARTRPSALPGQPLWQRKGDCGGRGVQLLAPHLPHLLQTGPDEDQIGDIWQDLCQWEASCSTIIKMDASEHCQMCCERLMKGLAFTLSLAVID